jgi:preprotein translocase subunit SecG
VYTLIMVLFIVVCIFLILVVLLQQGKGADAAAAFGGATSPTAFGPRGTTTLLHKLTTGSFVVFVALCILLSVLTARKGRSVTAGAKVKPVAAAPATPVPAPAGTTNPSPAAPAAGNPAAATPVPAEQPGK